MSLVVSRLVVRLGVSEAVCQLEEALSRLLRGPCGQKEGGYGLAAVCGWDDAVHCDRLARG